MIVLDTNILIEIDRGNNEVISRIAELRKEHPENMALTSAVYAELWYGFSNKNKKLPEEFAAFDIIDFDKESAELFAQKKKELERKGKPIPIFDLVTASCTIARGALLVSSDKHFNDIDGLQKLII